jgi:ABC-type amino acid transport substrate-binding protein
LTEIPNHTGTSTALIFSDDYYPTGQIAIIRADNKTLNKASDLKDKRLGALKNSNAYAVALQYSPIVQAYNNLASTAVDQGAIADLEQGGLDAVIADYNQALVIVRDDPTLQISGTLLERDGYGVAAAASRPQLAAKLKKIINQLNNNGTSEALAKKWPLI